MRRIIMYKGQMDVLDIFSSELEKGLKELGDTVFVFDFQKNNVEELSDFCNEKVDLVLTFNTMFHNVTSDSDQNIWSLLGIPYATILVDHPRNFAETLDTFEKKDKVYCIDKDHVEYAKRFFPNIGQVAFLPHGGTVTNEFKQPSWEQRKIDVLYAGSIPISCQDGFVIPKEIESKYAAIFDIRKASEDIFNLAKENYELPLETIVEAYMNEVFKNQLTDSVLKMLTIDFYFIHNYLLAYFREKILEAAAKSGAQIYIYGQDYSSFSFAKMENVHLMGLTTPEKILELMKDSKIVLSSMAWFKNGSHERIFNGMLSGAVVVSEESLYLQEEFKCDVSDEQELYTYSLGNLDALPGMINEILTNQEHSAKVIENASKIAGKHTWIERARMI